MLPAQHADVVRVAPRRTASVHTACKLHTHPVEVAIVEANSHRAATVVGHSIVCHLDRLHHLVSCCSSLRVEHLVHARAEATCNAVPVQGLLMILHALVAYHSALMARRWTWHAEAVPAAIDIVLSQAVVHPARIVLGNLIL